MLIETIAKAGVAGADEFLWKLILIQKNLNQTEKNMIKLDEVEDLLIKLQN